MSFHHRKVTVRFTYAEYALVAFAAGKLPGRWTKATVSKFLRQAAREKVAAMGITEEQLKMSDAGPAPKTKRTAHTVKR